MTALPAERRPLVRRYVGWTTLVYWVTLFVATHIPQLEIPLQVEGTDKLVHFSAYFVLGMLASMWFALGGRLTILHALLLFGLLTGYGAFDEWLQQFVRRDCDFKDWIADVTGAGLGIGLFTLLQWRKPLNRELPAENA